MDDCTPYGTTFDQSLTNLEKGLKRCIESWLSLSTDKCHVMMTEGIVLGNFISQSRIQVDPAKMLVILNLPVPTIQKEVRSFLGHAGYYRRFIQKISLLASPLFALLMKDVVFTWTAPCQDAFISLKQKFSIAPVLRGPDWNLPFHISSDASDTAIGAILSQ